MMNTDLIEKIYTRAETCLGVNPLPFDRLYKGNREEADFWASAIIERKEMLAALDTAAFLIAERDAELADLRESVKASGLVSMDIGAPRKPEKDQQ